ncbi:MAG: alpha-ketoglutarate-dependent dioxygenase AlkB [Pseudomonadota bacterium]|nr:alpha-ketoglutarate-dependent dioxygenase AlkB [Pseudomonadota bacterium]
MPDLFDSAQPGLQSLALPDGALRFDPAFYSSDFTATALYELINTTVWRHEQIVLFGKRYWQPRLVAAHGDPDTAYTYSGLTLPMHPWSPLLARIKQDIERACGCRFNSVLLNYYRDQHDSMGWHSDDESALGPAPVIASLSFGARRIFKLRHKTRADLATLSLALEDGSLLMMEGTTQRYWKHAVEKQRDASTARINLTFRQINPTRYKR